MEEVREVGGERHCVSGEDPHPSFLGDDAVSQLAGGASVHGVESPLD